MALDAFLKIYSHQTEDSHQSNTDCRNECGHGRMKSKFFNIQEAKEDGVNQISVRYLQVIGFYIRTSGNLHWGSLSDLEKPCGHEWLEGALSTFQSWLRGKVKLVFLFCSKEMKTSNLTLRKSFMFLTAHNSCLWVRAGWTPLFKKLRVNGNSAGKFTSGPMNNILIRFTFTWLSTKDHKPDTQHERAMVLQEWQHYMCACPAPLVLLQLLLLPGHFSAFIIRLQRAVTYGHIGVTLERREGRGIHWHSTGDLSPGHTRESRSSQGLGWAGSLAFHFYRGRRQVLSSGGGRLAPSTYSSFFHISYTKACCNNPALLGLTLSKVQYIMVCSFPFLWEWNLAPCSN